MNERLWTFGQQLPVDNKFQAVLKLAYLRQSLKQDAVDVSEYNKMCRKCHIPWTTGYFSVVIIPKCNRSSKQIEKLQSQKHLTKQQQSLVKHLKTRVGRVAKYTCKICSYKTRIPLDAKVKWPERTNPEPVSKERELKTNYNKWLEETQQKRKRHGNSNAGLKIPHKSNTPNNIGKGCLTQGNNTPSGPKKGFKPTDFKLIQQLLESTVSSNSNTKSNQKPKGNQPVGRLRLSRS